MSDTPTKLVSAAKTGLNGNNKDKGPRQTRFGGNGDDGGRGNDPEHPTPESAPENSPLFHTKRNSIFPLMVDVGAVCFAFGLIILSNMVGPLAGQIAMAVGVFVVVIGLIGWAREARADYKRLSE